MISAAISVRGCFIQNLTHRPRHWSCQLAFCKRTCYNACCVHVPGGYATRNTQYVPDSDKAHWGLTMEALVNGIHLHHVQAGNGIPLLLIHGYPLDHTLWQPQVNGLADIARVIAPDLRGFGQSDAPKGAYTMETHADDLRALLDVLQVERAVVCGLSMGGYIALAFWRKYVDRVRGLILVDTRAGADAPAARQARLDMVEQVKQHGSAPAADAMLSRLLAPSTRQSRPDLVESIHAMMLRQRSTGIIGAQLGMAERPDSTAMLPTITVPTLVVFGAEDVITPAETEGRSLADAIAGAKLVIIPNAGHLSNLEQPEAFNAAVREFLSANPGIARQGKC
jgi:3-oxoadipate enol-lactonase